MKSTSSKLGSIAVTLECGQVNALLQTLNCISVTNTENQYAKDAAKLRDKIIKPSALHGANLAHNNREFSAANIDPSRSEQNIFFTQSQFRMRMMHCSVKHWKHSTQSRIVRHGALKITMHTSRAKKERSRWRTE